MGFKRKYDKTEKWKILCNFVKRHSFIPTSPPLYAYNFSVLYCCLQHARGEMGVGVINFRNPKSHIE